MPRTLSSLCCAIFPLSKGMLAWNSRVVRLRAFPPSQRMPDFARRRYRPIASEAALKVLPDLFLGWWLVRSHVNSLFQGENNLRSDFRARCLSMEVKELHSMGRAMERGAGSGCTLPCLNLLLAALPCVPDRWFMAPSAFIPSLDEHRLVRLAYVDLTWQTPRRARGVFLESAAISSPCRRPLPPLPAPR